MLTGGSGLTVEEALAGDVVEAHCAYLLRQHTHDQQKSHLVCGGHQVGLRKVQCKIPRPKASLV
jgi:hypothetical protein